MSKINNQKVWKTAIAAFPYALQSPKQNLGQLTTGSRDFAYAQIFTLSIGTIFNDKIIADVRIDGSRQAGSVHINAFISLYLNELHPDLFLSYGSAQGHSGLYNAETQQWHFSITH